jgi:hypothetical protein
VLDASPVAVIAVVAVAVGAVVDGDIAAKWWCSGLKRGDLGCCRGGLSQLGSVCHRL